MNKILNFNYTKLRSMREKLAHHPFTKFKRSKWVSQKLAETALFSWPWATRTGRKRQKEIKRRVSFEAGEQYGNKGRYPCKSFSVTSTFEGLLLPREDLLSFDPLPTFYFLHQPVDFSFATRGTAG